MSLVKWIIVGLLALPVLEIVAFVAVAGVIGGFWALALMIATSMAGVILLRSFGTASLVRVRNEATGGGFQAVSLETPGLGAVAGALLLVIPGFITDCIGAALLAPPVRRWLSAAFRRAGKAGMNRDRPAIDLDPADWRREPDRPLPDRRNLSEP